MRGGDYYVFTMSCCPDVCPVDPLSRVCGSVQQRFYVKADFNWWLPVTTTWPWTQRSCLQRVQGRS